MSKNRLKVGLSLSTKDTKCTECRNEIRRGFGFISIQVDSNDVWRSSKIKLCKICFQKIFSHLLKDILDQKKLNDKFSKLETRVMLSRLKQ